MEVAVAATQALKDEIDSVPRVIDIVVNLDKDAIPGQLAEIKEEVQAATADMPVDADLDPGSLAKIEDEIKSATGDVPVEADLDPASLAKIKAALSSLFANIPATLDEDQVDEAILRIKSELQALEADIRSGVDEPSLAEAIATIKAALATIKENIPAVADTESVIAAINQIQAMLTAAKPTETIEAKVDQASVAAAASEIGALTDALNKQAGADDALAAAEARLNAFEEAGLAAARARIATTSQQAAADQAGLAVLREISAAQAAAASSDQALEVAHEGVTRAAVAEAAAARLVVDSNEQMASGFAPLLTSVRGLEVAHEGNAAAAVADASAAKSWATALAAALVPLPQLASGTKAAGDAATTASNSFRLWGTGLAVTGNMIHWIIAGGFELLAVTAPAAVALVSAALTGMQGAAENAGRQMEALQTSTEATSQMLGVTAGQALGLKSELQAAQDAANPGVYEMLGSALNDAKENMTNFANEGLQVIHIMDEFTAKVTVDLRGSLGSELNQLVSGAVSDLTNLGQVLGNLGHAFINLAADMPGIAEVILKIVAAFSQLIEWVTEIPAPIVTTVMALEEFVRWGGLVVNLAGQLAGGFAKVVGAAGNVAGAMSKLASDGSIVESAFKGISSGATAAEGGLNEFKGAVTGAKNSTLKFKNSLSFFATNPFGWAIVAGAAVAALGVWLAKAQTPSEALAASFTKMTQAATGLDKMNVLASGIQAVGNSANQSAQSINHASTAMTALAMAAQTPVLGNFGNVMTNLGIRTQGVTTDLNAASIGLNAFGGPIGQVTSMVTKLWGSFTGASTAVKNMQDADTGMQALRTQMLNVVSGAATVAQMTGTTLPQAMGVASMAGVDLTKSIQGNSSAAVIARQQITNLLTGYQAMDQTGSILAEDINAVNFGLQLQGTEVSKLNQGWDTYISTLTGGTSALGSFNTDLQQMGNAVDNSTKAFHNFSGNTTLSFSQIASALKSFSGNSAQVWQNFDQAVTQANTTMDQLRNEAAVGAISQQQYSGAIKGVVAELIPYASQSKIAQETLMGLYNESGQNVTSFGQLKSSVGNTKTAQADLNNAVAAGVTSMANLNQAVAGFSGTLKSDAVAAMASGAANMGQLSSQTQAFTQAAQKAGSVTGQAATDLQTLDQHMSALGFTTQDITAMNENLGKQFGLTTTQAKALATQATATKTAQDELTTSTGNLTAAQLNNVPQVKAVTAALQAAHVPTTTITTDENNLITAYKNHGAASPQVEAALTAITGLLNSAHVPTSTQTSLINALTAALKGIPASVSTTVTETGTGEYTISGGVLTAAGAAAQPTNPSSLLTPASGGYVTGPGTSTSDSIPAMLSNSEYVMNAAAVSHYGVGFMHSLNAMKLAAGGFVFNDTGNQQALTGALAVNGQYNTWNDLTKALEAALNAALHAAAASALAGVTASGVKGATVTYDSGGWLPPGTTLAQNNTGRHEYISPPGGGGGYQGPSHVVIEMNGQRVAQALMPQIVAATGRYGIRNSGRVTGILKPT